MKKIYPTAILSNHDQAGISVGLKIKIFLRQDKELLVSVSPYLIARPRAPRFSSRIQNIFFARISGCSRSNPHPRISRGCLNFYMSIIEASVAPLQLSPSPPITTKPSHPLPWTLNQ